MSRRPDPIRKKTPDFLHDLLEGHRQAALNGPEAARKYLERTIAGQHSLPNAVKFFAYDLLCEAADQCEEHATRDEAVDQALKYLAAAREDLPRELQAWLPTMRCFEVGIGAAMDDGRFEQALALAEQAIELFQRADQHGLGKVYEQKADSIRWMV